MYSQPKACEHQEGWEKRLERPLIIVQLAGSKIGRGEEKVIMSNRSRNERAKREEETHQQINELQALHVDIANV